MDVERTNPDEERMRKAAVTYGESQAINPFRALLNEVARAAGHSAWLGQRLAAEPADTLVWEGSAADRWRSLYVAERRLLLQSAETCVRLGLADRQVALAERQGELITQLLMRVADGLNLSESQRAVLPGLLTQELALIETTAAEGLEQPDG